jgi:hypothetical protein
MEVSFMGFQALFAGSWELLRFSESILSVRQTDTSWPLESEIRAFNTYYEGGLSEIFADDFVRWGIFYQARNIRFHTV